MSGYCPKCGNTLCVCKDMRASNSCHSPTDTAPRVYQVQDGINGDVYDCVELSEFEKLKEKLEHFLHFHHSDKCQRMIDDLVRERDELLAAWRGANAERDTAESLLQEMLDDGIPCSFEQWRQRASALLGKK